MQEVNSNIWYLLFLFSVLCLISQQVKSDNTEDSSTLFDTSTTEIDSATDGSGVVDSAGITFSTGDFGRVSGYVATSGGVVSTDMYSDDRGFEIREVTGLTYLSKGELYAEKAEEFRSGETTVTSASEITHSSDSLTIGRAAEVRISDFQLYGIEGFMKRGDEIYIEKGDLVIDGQNYSISKTLRFSSQVARL